MTTQVVLTVLFTVLAVIALRFWLRTRDTKSFYVALMFVPLGAVEIWTLGNQFSGANGDSASLAYQIGTRLMFVMIILYPWALYQFASYVRRKHTKIGQILAIAVSIPLVAFVLLWPWPEDPQNPQFTAIMGIFFLAFSGQFIILSATAAYKLWRTGAEQPTVVRIRLRLMSAAALLLSAALCIGSVGGSADTRSLLINLLYTGTAILSTILFMLCLAPPRMLRINWSYTAISDVREVTRSIISSESRSSAVALALPIMSQVIGSTYAIGYDTNGEVLAHWPADKEIPPREELEGHTIVIPMETEGQLVLQTNALWPFVGQEEIDLLEFVGSAVGLALNRRRLDDANSQLRVQSAVERSLRMQAEELERANRELNEFVAVASHDLQTPVRNIIDNIEFLDQDLEDEQQLGDEAKQDLEFIRDGAHRVKALIDGLLHYTRVDALGTGENVEVELNSVLDQVLASMNMQLLETNTTIKVEPLPKVLGVYSELGEVFGNLFDNAIKYRSPDRRCEINVSSAIHSQGFVDIIVTDNGIGIAPEFRERVFEMFKRLHAHDEIQGTGIGLAVCRKIVERMGGQIAFEEPRGAGSQLRITLPISERGYIGRVA